MASVKNPAMKSNSNVKTVIEPASNVGFQRSERSPSPIDPDKTGEGRIFRHKVGEIEIEITDDVGSRGFHLVTASL